jgi:hypothetical protein
MDSTAPPRDGTPAPWPDGTRCPLCLAHDVTGATFHFEIEKTGKEGESEAAGWLTVRARCCEQCRRRVLHLGQMRLAVLPIVVLGTIAWPLSLVSTLPMRLLGLERLEMLMVTTLLCALVVGVPLVLLDHANRSLRKNLETSWLFRRIRTRVQRAVSKERAPNDHWRVLPKARESAIVVEATELLRSETV